MPEALTDHAPDSRSWIAVGALAMGVALAIIDLIPAADAEGSTGIAFVLLFVIGLVLAALASGLAAYDIASLALKGTGAAVASAVVAAVALYPLLSRPGYADLHWLTLYVVALGLAWLALRRSAASLVFLVMASAGALAWAAGPLLSAKVGI